MSGLIAIVGRPNVGKSALFNRIARRRIAIVHDQPGVTRDRVSAEAEWEGHSFTLVDTGGIGLLRGEKADDIITRAALEQVELAIDAASVIILVVNVQEGIVPLDQEVAKRLRKSGKTVFVAANKSDTYKAETAADDFAELGFEKIFPVSAIHGKGIDALMAAATKLLPKVEKSTAESDSEPSTQLDENGEVVVEEKLERVKGPIKLAIVGRPNVGKSSIINALTQSSRVIVSPIPGTTRDSVDVPFEVVTEGVKQQYILIDTAGLRKSRRVDDSVEFFSTKRTEEAIARCDIAILVLDAVDGITEQDKKVADKIVQERRACIVVVNKWDLVEDEVLKAREKEIDRRVAKVRNRDGSREKQLTTLGEFGAWVQERLFFLDYAPVIFTSATSGFHLDRLLEAVRYVEAELRKKIPTGILNRTLNDAVVTQQPVSAAGHRLKFFYATQVRQAPPTFLLFVNKDELFSDQYKKYLADSMRKSFGFEGCPIIIVPKARPKTIESFHQNVSGGRGGAKELRRGDKPPQRRPRSVPAEQDPRAIARPAARPGARPDARATAKPTGRPAFRPGPKAKPRNAPRRRP